MTRYRWVAARKAEGFPITAACTAAEVSRQAFCDWRLAEAAGPSAAERAEAELVEEIRSIHGSFDGTYGEPRITEELARRGRPTNHKRVERLNGPTASWGCTSRPRSAPPSRPRTPRRCRT